MPRVGIFFILLQPFSYIYIYIFLVYVYVLEQLWLVNGQVEDSTVGGFFSPTSLYKAFVSTTPDHL